MLWLPHHVVEVEMLAPAFQDAGVDDERMAAVRVRKDILNLLLADLIETGAAEFAEANSKLSRMPSTPWFGRRIGRAKS